MLLVSRRRRLRHLLIKLAAGRAHSRVCITPAGIISCVIITRANTERANSCQAEPTRTHTKHEHFCHIFAEANVRRVGKGVGVRVSRYESANVLLLGVA